jgi:hypothetical protein
MYNQDIKAYIKRLYSEELEHDESIGAAMERQQLRKWLLAWANDSIEETMQKIQLDIKDKNTEAYMRQWAKDQPLKWSRQE